MISISIVSHAQNALVNRLLRDLMVVEPQTEVEIIITENIPGDVEFEHAATGGNVRLIRNTNPQSYARNHNSALLDARGNYYCILNPDVRWMQPVFSRLLSRFENGDADIVAPLVVDATGVTQDSFRPIPTPGDLFRRRILNRGLHPLPYEPGEFMLPDWIAGMFMLMPAGIFQQLGGFDESYRMYFEDVDFCARARLAGLRIGVDTSVTIQHEGRRSSRKSLKYLLWHAVSALRFFTSPIYRQIRSYASDTER